MRDMKRGAAGVVGGMILIGIIIMFVHRIFNFVKKKLRIRIYERIKK